MYLINKESSVCSLQTQLQNTFFYLIVLIIFMVKGITFNGIIFFCIQHFHF